MFITVASVLSLLYSQASLVSAAAVESKEFDLYQSLGNLSPYHKAPVPYGIQEDLPADCTIDQVMLTGRHGSRYPLVTELPYVQNLTYLLGNNSDAIQKARLPKELQFLKDGYTTTLGHDDLTPPGREQLFSHGVNFRLKYPQFNAKSILAGDQDRVIESAQWFAQGYFGRAWVDLNATAFSTIPEDNVTISWITPFDTCAKWTFGFGLTPMNQWDAKYLPAITKRLNKLVPGVNFTDDHTHGALYACAYDNAAHGVSPWCDVFTESEIKSFEYELDLEMNGAFGYAQPDGIGPIVGSLYVNKLIERFTNSSGDAEPVYLEFGHDTTIDNALTGLGLAKDPKGLNPDGPPNPNRAWRTSNQVPFGAQMVWEKFSCTSSFKGPQIRLVLNDSPFPLTICGGMSKQLGTCSLDDFLASTKSAQGIKWGDAAWNSSCGASAF